MKTFAIPAFWNATNVDDEALEEAGVMVLNSDGNRVGFYSFSNALADALGCGPRSHVTMFVPSDVPASFLVMVQSYESGDTPDNSRYTLRVPYRTFADANTAFMRITDAMEACDDHGPWSVTLKCEPNDSNPFVVNQWWDARHAMLNMTLK